MISAGADTDVTNKATMVLSSSRRLQVAVLLAALITGTANAEQKTPAMPAVDARAQQLKFEVLELHAEMAQLLDELEHPAAQRLSVYLHDQRNGGDKLEQVIFSMDGREQPPQPIAQSAPITRLFYDNVKPGKHQIKITFVTRNSRGRIVELRHSWPFQKQTSIHNLLITLQQDASGTEILAKLQAIEP